MTNPTEQEIAAKLKSYDHPSTMCGPIFIEIHTDILHAADLIERLVKERDALREALDDLTSDEAILEASHEYIMNERNGGDRSMRKAITAARDFVIKVKP